MGTKTYGLIILGMVLGAVLIICAQEAAPPSVDLYEELPEATVTPTVPPNGPELPELKQLDATFKPPNLGSDAEWTTLRNSRSDGRLRQLFIEIYRRRRGL